jgi:hypothetical protein
MWTIIFQCASTRPSPDWLPPGLDTIEDLLEWRNDQTLLPKKFKMAMPTSLFSLVVNPHAPRHVRKKQVQNSLGVKLAPTCQHQLQLVKTWSW